MNNSIKLPNKPKILLWLDADFTQFTIAYFLQKKIDCEFYAIIDITNKPKNFFLSQKLIKFKKVWYYHDSIRSKSIEYDVQYLENIEKKYQIKLWQLGINERIFYRFFSSHRFKSEEILSIIEQSCKLFEQVLDDVKPDFFLSQAPVFHHHEILYRMLRIQKVKCLILSIPRIANKCLISESIHKIDNIENLNSVKSKGRDEKTLREYIRKHSSQKQIKEYWQKMERRKPSQLVALFSYLFTENKNEKTHYTYYGRTKFNVLSNLILLKFKKRIREYFMDRHLQKNLDTSKPFIYFPLSVDMERNLLIDTPLYTNQVEVIRNIVRTMPVNYKLFVKENPAQVGREWRTISEYKEILAIPNVTLFHPSSSGQDFIKNASLVISISGASALEAAFYAKPSIVFSDIIYSYLPSVIKVDALDELDQTIKNALNIHPNSDDIDKFVQLLEENTVDFDLLRHINNFDHEFYYNGALFDVTLDEAKIKKFFNMSEDLTSNLVLKYVNKIKKHEKFSGL